MPIKPSIITPEFDSYFEPAMPGKAAQLRIKLRVKLVPLDPLLATKRPTWRASLLSHLAQDAAGEHQHNVFDADGKQFMCRSWHADEWDEYTRRFKHSVENAWNNQMILLPVELGGPHGSLSDADFRQLIGKPTTPAHVEGVLEIELTSLHDATAHAVIEVVHLKTPSKGQFRSDMERLTDEDVLLQKSTFTYGKLRTAVGAAAVGGTTGQITAAHEIGHWLRGAGEDAFDHIDHAAALRLPRVLPKKEQEDLEDAAEYGLTLSRFYSIMGGGSLATPYDVLPWKHRLIDHTGLKFAWLFVHRLKFHADPSDVSEHQRRVA